MRLPILIVLLFFVNQLEAQTVNAYAKVTSFASTTLSLSDIDQTAHDFIVGEYVVVMQMQDDVIGTNTTNATTFGDLSGIASAGLYEIRQIIAVDGNTTAGYMAASPATLQVDRLVNTYNTGANMSVQIITFRQLSVDDYTTTGDIAALDWNGNIGGVVAIYVPGILTLNHSISVEANGFRGGGRSDNFWPLAMRRA